jgi:hypothetical protein
MLTREVYKALGFSPQAWYHNLLDPIFQAPARRLTQVAASFDAMVQRCGLPEAARWVLPHFIAGLKVRGMENIPAEGPLLVAANHPGAADSLCHAASVKRKDLRIIASDIPFLRHLPGLTKHLIPVSGDPFIRMGALRTGLRHLQDGGALLLFSTGRIDPDLSVHPKAQAQAELENWSGSLEIFLRRVPEAQVVLGIASGVVARSCWRNPLKYLKQTPLDRRRIAEFLQVMLQMGWGWKFNLQARVSYARQVGLETLAEGKLLEEIKDRARALLAEHQAALAESAPTSFQPVILQG